MRVPSSACTYTSSPVARLLSASPILATISRTASDDTPASSARWRSRTKNRRAPGVGSAMLPAARSHRHDVAGRLAGQDLDECPIPRFERDSLLRVVAVAVV